MMIYYITNIIIIMLRMYTVIFHMLLHVACVSGSYATPYYYYHIIRVIIVLSVSM